MLDLAAERDLVLVNKNYLVVNKQSGVHGHGQRASDQQTTLAFWAQRYPEILISYREKNLFEGSLLHRLDQGTSGILIFARNHAAFKKAIQHWSQATTKIYLAWVHNHFSEPLAVELGLKHDAKSKKRMQFDNAKNCKLMTRTQFFPVKYDKKNNASLVLVQIHSGVMHQIRVVSGLLGHGVVGDTLYKNLKPLQPKMREQKICVVTKPFKALAQRIDQNKVLPLIGCRPEQLTEVQFYLHHLFFQSRELTEFAGGVLAWPQADFWYQK